MASVEHYLSDLTSRFGSPADLSDLSHPVAYARNLAARGYPVIFDLRHLAHASGVSSQTLGLIRRNPASFYKRFIIRKRNGGSREIAAPTPELKRIQQWLNRNIAQNMRMHEAAHGFRGGRSIATNAALHSGAEVVLCLDLRDFFGTVRRRNVFAEFRRAGYSRDVAAFMTDLVTLDGHLPQGAPTSPAIGNAAALRLDVRLDSYATKKGVSYSRYADDLCFSGPTTAVHGHRFKRTIESILRDSGFAPRKDKTRYMDQSARQSVAGVVVNERPNAPRERRRWIRQEIHYLERFGVEEHVARRGPNQRHYRAFIYGHVVALFVTNPEEAAGYLRRLDDLTWE